MAKGRTWRVAVCPGDGIGPEVMAPTVAALRAVAGREGLALELQHYDWPSHDWHRRHGEMMPGDWREQLAAHDAILLGALGDPGPTNDPDRYLLSDGVSLAPLLQLRKGFDLWACERPAVRLPGTPQYLADPAPRNWTCW